MKRPRNSSLDYFHTQCSKRLTSCSTSGFLSRICLDGTLLTSNRPSIVPVGEDQLQHIEFTRTLARGFNAHVNQKVFRIPWPVICETPEAERCALDSADKKQPPRRESCLLSVRSIKCLNPTRTQSLGS